MGGRGRPKYPGLLTPREAQVVDRVARGKTNREIAEELGISEQGVKYHLNEVYSKTGLGSREELIAWRRERRWSERLLPAWMGVGRAATVAGIGGLGLVFVAALVALSGSGEDEPGTVPNDNGDAQTVGYTPVARPTLAVEPNLPPCATGSVIIPPGTAVACVASVDDAQANVTFQLYTPPDWRRPRFVAAATTSNADGPGAFLRYEIDGRQIDILEADLPFEWRMARARGGVPFMAGPTQSLGFVEFPAQGAVLRWCPFWQGEMEPDDDRCPRKVQVVLHGMVESDLAKLGYDIKAERTGLGWQFEGLSTEPTPIPFVSRGGRVAPYVMVPVFPGAVEVDGFLTPDYGPLPPTATQVFETDQALEDVLLWYERELQAKGWRAGPSAFGPAGRATSGAKDKDHIRVTTAPVLREDEEGTPPPGFRGKDVPFEHKFNGKWVFWVSTWVEN